MKWHRDRRPKIDALSVTLPSSDEFTSTDEKPDLKGRTIRGGALTVSSQFVQFGLFIVSTVVLARLLSPEDYGMVGMVLAVTGLLGLVKDSGLSTATVQRESLSPELVSTVFWLNMLVGAVATLMCAVLAPFIALFYHEPRLQWIALAIASTFLIDAAGAQHVALLRRQLRWRAAAVIDTLSMITSVVTAIVMAFAGFGYWALVGMRIVAVLTSTLAAWFAVSWRPGRPRYRTGVRSMLRFGGYLTGASLVNYSFRNVDNVLIGWFWGAGSVGLYQKAYSLLMLPINQVNGPMSGVAVATLSRLQTEPQRQRRYFVGGYSIAASIVVPIVVAAFVFSEDIIRFVLGDQWRAATNIFRYLAPAALIGALLNPLGWIFVSTGRADRQLRASLVWSPLIILAFAIGLRFGPEGVAIGYSAMSALLAIPMCLYAVRGTSIRPTDIARALLHPVIAGFAAGLTGIALKQAYGDEFSVGLRAVTGCMVIVAVYAFFLLVVLRQWARYRELIRHLSPRGKSDQGQVR